MSTLHVAAKRRTGDFEVDVRFQAKPGITILFGPSGAGKSTTLSMIAGILRPDAGDIRLGDAAWFDSKAQVNVPIQKRKVGFVFQSLALFPHLTAAENVAYGLPRGLTRGEIGERVAAMLDRLKVAHVATRKPPTFSGGEAQRVALARAFAIEPAILLLDEPFSALDRPLRRELHADVRKMVDSLSLPTILITHHPNEARALGDSVVMLHAGKVTGVGSVAEMLPDGPRPSDAPPSLDRLDFADTPMATPESFL
jgi:molybdate transport system ATP-binding protein